MMKEKRMREFTWTSEDRREGKRPGTLTFGR
jgi:hypothetical protein